MSDFDAVLERLLTDPGFAASLAADRSAALSGYHLAPEEIALLSAQLGGDQGGQRAVEARQSKAGVFGLLAPLAEAVRGGFAEAARSGFAETTRGGRGPAGQADHPGFDPAGHGGRSGSGEHSRFTATGAQGFGGGPGAAAAEGFGPGPGAPVSEGFGAAEGSTGRLVDDGFGTAPAPWGAGGRADSSLSQGAPPADYRTRIDVDGDGRWDQHAYRARVDGGVDIVADLDRDGRADFVGRDYDSDGLVDAADYDKDQDGRFETHMFDDDRDGWMDRKTIS